MLVDKFSWHLPLYRQHARMEAAGIALSRATLTNWSRRAIDLLKPICDAQWASVLQGNVIAMDETGIRAGRVARGKMRQAKFWPVYGERDEIVFHYARDRKHERVPEIPGSGDTWRIQRCSVERRLSGLRQLCRRQGRGGWARSLLVAYPARL